MGATSSTPEHLLSGVVDWVIRFDVLSPSGVMGPSGSAAVIRWSDARPSDRSYKARYASSSNATGTEFDRMMMS